jgi:hypothetical protein
MHVPQFAQGSPVHQYPHPVYPEGYTTGKENGGGTATAALPEEDAFVEIRVLPTLHSPVPKFAGTIATAGAGAAVGSSGVSDPPSGEAANGSGGGGGNGAATIDAAAPAALAPTPSLGAAPLTADAVYLPTAVSDRYSFLSTSK